MTENLATAARARIEERLKDCLPTLLDMAKALVAAPSPNPPGDVSEAARVSERLLAAIPGMSVRRYETAPGIVNLVGVLKGAGQGRRFIFNGHLDTFPLGEDLGWTVPPLGGVIADGKLYGRGVSDMKGGIAASLVAASLLAAERDSWAGELVVTLAGDEESMGSLGTRWLLDNVPEARGDAMLCGDVGSPLVVRFGEKGLLWLDISAKGSPAHGAHVHKGVNAIDRLRLALDRLKSLESLTPVAPPDVTAAIAAARDLSEPISGAGESDVLQSLTVNIGVIEGGVSPNLVPSQALARADIRIPVGLTLAQVKKELASRMAELEGVSYRIVQEYEPRFTAPSEEIVTRTLDVAEAVLGQRPVANMRVGASDARLYRLYDVPSVVFGCTPFGMGGPDEYVLIDELHAVAKVHALTAFDYLRANKGG